VRRWYWLSHDDGSDVTGGCSRTTSQGVWPESCCGSWLFGETTNRFTTSMVSFLIAVNGPIAYAMCPSFSFGSHMMSCTIKMLGFIPVTVNGWHALFHFVTGVAGVFAARQLRSAFWYGIGCGWLYLFVAGMGLAGGNNVLHLMAVDTFGNWVHAVEGGLVITAAALTSLRTPALIKRSRGRIHELARRAKRYRQQPRADRRRLDLVTWGPRGERSRLPEVPG